MCHEQLITRPTRRLLALLPMCAACLLAVGSERLRAQPAEDRPAIRDIAFTSDGRYFAATASVGKSQGVLAIWRADTWQLVHQFSEPAGFGRFAFSPDDASVAVTRFERPPVVIHLETGAAAFELQGHEESVRCVAFTPDGATIVTGGFDQTVRSWDAATGKLLETIADDVGGVYDLEVSPDGEHLAVADRDQFKLRLVDLPTHETVFESPRMGSLIAQVAFSPDGRLVAASSWGGYSRIYEVESKQLRLQLDTNSANSTSFSPDGRNIAVAAQLHVYVFSFPQPDASMVDKIETTLQRLTQDDYDVRERAHEKLRAFGGVGESLLRDATESEHPEIRWRARKLHSHVTSTEGARKLPLDAEAGCAVFSPDGTLLVSGDKEGNLVAWRVADWAPERRFAIPVDD